MSFIRRFPLLSRRAFVTHLGCAAGAGVIVGFDPLRHSWVTAADLAGGDLVGVPELAGVLVSDEPALAEAADDRGHIIRLRPRAVLRPGSVDDVVRMVRFANERGLTVAMRGQAHSHYGHAQAEGGIVIDSTTLRRVAAPAGRSLDTQPGASWGDVADAAVAAGLTPPVMPDVMMLSVGGTLSVGGLGATSQHYGSQADNVEELDVVTGDARLVTCSPDRERELFELVLAGVGQVGLIVRARLRLIDAPQEVTLWELGYDDLDTYLEDHERLARDGRFPHQYGWVARTEGGGWRPVIQAGVFGGPEAGDEPLSGLRFSTKSEPQRSSYRGYLDRLAEFVARARQGAEWRLHPSPSVTLFLPVPAARPFIERVLRTPEDTEGVWRFDVCPLNTGRFTRPTLRMPEGDVVFSLWMFRTAPTPDLAAAEPLIATARSLLERMREAGGTPYAPYFMGSPDGWRGVLGEEIWRRLAAARERFDPNGVLTPGARFFA